MIVIKGNISKLEPLTEPLALTVGNFDGVHRGHSYLLQSLKKEAYCRGVKTAILTFDPHPHSLLKTSSFKPLQTRTMKTKHLEKQNLDYLIIQNFDRKFSDVPKEDFLGQYLMNFFEIRFLLFGYDFYFGRKGEGNFDFAKRFLRDKNIECHQSGIFKKDGQIVSSSRIRDFLTRGEIEKANRNLGYPFSIEGKVVRGKSLGQKLGFPTANLQEVYNFIPRQGVYAGWANWANEKRLAVMNIGLCPSIREQKEISLECHIPNFCGNLYNQKFRFHFIKKLRDEKKFPSLNELKNQIKQDLEEVQKMVWDDIG